MAGLAVAAGALALASGGGTVLGEGEATFKVEIENLSQRGQPFTPALLAVHSAAADLFEVGEPASAELQQIAENGNLPPMIELLEGSAAVSAVVVGSGPVLPRQTHVLMVRGDDDSYLSFVSMLICTNDGFAGIDSLAFADIEGSVTLDVNAYDAGTEVNTQDFADIVPPCQGLVGVSSPDEGTGASNPDLAEDGVIAMHAGVFGGNDLTASHMWTGPIARATITRVEISPPSTGSGGLLSGTSGSSGWLLAAMTGLALALTAGAAARYARR